MTTDKNITDKQALDNVKSFSLDNVSDSEALKNVSLFQSSGTANETYFRQDTGKVIDAPSGLGAEHLEYLDDTQNNNIPKSNFFGYSAVTDSKGSITGVEVPSLFDFGKDFLKAQVQSISGTIAATREGDRIRRADLLQSEIDKPSSGFAFPSVIQARVLAASAEGNPERKKRLQISIEKLRKAASDIEKSQKDFVLKHGLNQEGALYQIETVASQVVLSIGALALFRNPVPLAIAFSKVQKESIYKEAAKKLDTVSADFLSSISGLVEGVIELFGGKVMLGILKHGKRFGAVMFGALEEGAQGFLQQTSEEVLTQATGVREKKLSDTAKDIFASTMIEALGGGLGVGLIKSLRLSAERNNVKLTKKQEKEVVSIVQKTKPKIESMIAEEISNQTSKSTQDTKNESRAAKVFKQFTEGKSIDLSQFTPEERFMIESALSEQQAQSNQQQEPLTELQQKQQKRVLKIESSQKLKNNVVDKFTKQAIKAQERINKAKDSNEKSIAEDSFVVLNNNVLSKIKSEAVASKESGIISVDDSINIQKIAKKITNKTPIQKKIQALKRINDLTKQGRLKLDKLKARKETRKQDRVDRLSSEKTKSFSERANDAKSRFVDALNKVREINLSVNTMDVFFDLLDNFSDFSGVNYTIFKKRIDKSYSKYLQSRERSTRQVKDLTDKLDLNTKDFNEIAIVAISEQEGGLAKLEQIGITEAEVENIKLSKNQQDMLDLMRSKFKETFPPVKKVMFEVYNKHVEEVDFFFPFLTDFDASTELEIQDTIGLGVPEIKTQKDVQRNFTITRVGGKQKVRIDALDVFLKHMDNANYLVHMGQDIKELGDLAISDEYKAVAGDLGQDIVVKWIDLLSRQGISKDRINSVEVLRRNIAIGILGYKLSTVLIQPLALGNAAAIIGAKPTAAGVRNIATSKEWRLFVKTNMPELRERIGDDPEYINLGGENAITKNAFMALKTLDSLSAASVASGAYIKSVEERGGVVDLSSPDPLAIEDAQRAVRLTQASPFSKDQSPLIAQGRITGNSSIDKAITQFQTFIISKFSTFRHEFRGLGIKDKKLSKKSANMIFFLLLTGAGEVAALRFSQQVVALLTATDLDPWEDKVKKQAISNLLGNVPIVGGAVNSLQYGAVPIPAVSLSVSVAKQAAVILNSKKSSTKIKATLDAVTTIGALAGVPASIQAQQIIDNALKKGKKRSSLLPVK